MRLAALLVLAACGSTTSAPVHLEPPAPEGAAAADALRGSKFSDAARIASRVLEAHPHDSRSAAVRAIANYHAAGSELFWTLRDVIDKADHVTAFDHEEGRKAWRAFGERLSSIDADLAVVAADPQFSLELCLACWEYDWNHNGRIDERDRKLFELEYDGDHGVLPDGDPRRRPTFRFDVGDAEWGRAMIAFQRAFVELVLAYQWSDLDKLLYRGDYAITLRVFSKPGVSRARDFILAGLAHSAKSRELYLAETDDDREWLPNPNQKNHPMPLPVDAELYETWANVITDARALLESKQGLSIREIASIVEPRAVMLVPDAYIDVGAMLRDPADITIDLKKASPTPEGIETVLRQVLGHGYATKMAPSPLVGRLSRVMKEVDHGGSTLERKLRYLLWVN